MFSHNELELVKVYGIPEKYKVLAKFSGKIVGNILFEFGEAPGKPVIYDPPRIIFDGGNFYKYKDNSNRKGEVRNYKIVGEIEDIILEEECKALIVRGERYYGKKAENCINAIYFNEHNQKVIIWAPSYKELFLELAGDTNICNASELHYKILKEISFNLEGKSLEEQKRFNVNEITKNYFGNKLWEINKIDFFPLDARLYHSIIKSIMISEDIKYPTKKGREKILESYYDLVIKNMDIDTWRKVHKLN